RGRRALLRSARRRPSQTEGEPNGAIPAPCRGSPPPLGGRAAPRGVDPAEAPLAAAEVGDGGRQVLAAEVGPRARREVEPRRRALPEEEIAEPLLAARAH